MNCREWTIVKWGALAALLVGCSGENSPDGGNGDNRNLPDCGFDFARNDYMLQTALDNDCEYRLVAEDGEVASGTCDLGGGMSDAPKSEISPRPYSTFNLWGGTGIDDSPFERFQLDVSVQKDGITWDDFVGFKYVLGSDEHPEFSVVNGKAEFSANVYYFRATERVTTSNFSEAQMDPLYASFDCGIIAGANFDRRTESFELRFDSITPVCRQNGVTYFETHGAVTSTCMGTSGPPLDGVDDTRIEWTVTF